MSVSTLSVVEKVLTSLSHASRGKPAEVVWVIFGGECGALFIAGWDE